MTSSPSINCHREWSMFFRSVQQTIHFTGKLSHPVKTCSVRQTHVAGILTDPKPMNTQITSCMRNGLVEDARKLFDEMPLRNTVTWNSMIRGFFQNGEFDYAFNLFDQMPTRDLFTYNTMLTGLMQYGETDSAKMFFDQMPYKDVVSWNSMIAGFVNNSLMSEALECFEQMPVRNVISWNLVMSGMLNYGSFDIVERLFREMPNRDIASSTIMISGLVRTGRIFEARGLFEEMPMKDVKAWNTMLIGYVENERIEIAEGLFFKMPERDTDSWNEMINGFVGCQRINDAVRLFSEMPEKSSRTWNSIFLGLIRNGCTEAAHGFFEKNPFNDIVSWTNMIIGYFELGMVAIAMKLFKSMPNKDQTAWNATIFGLGENDHGEEGLKLFMRMKEEGGAFPDEATFTTVLTISSILPSLDFGKQVHGLILKTGFDYITAVSNAIITMYARCGNMSSALLGFTYAPKRDVVSWNSIICGFAQHGNGIEALEMFKKMQDTGFKADQITFVGVLSACSHTGLIEHGKHYFNFMKFKCFIEPTCEHYTCMVDLLGRFGFIEEAMSFIDQMKVDGIEISTSVWGALVGACRIHKNTRIGEIAAEKVLEIEPCNAGIYMILAEMYLSNGRRKDAERILARMKENNVKKQPGCSWIEVNNSVNVFLAGHGSHPEFSRVCYALELLSMEMEAGFL